MARGFCWAACPVCLLPRWSCSGVAFSRAPDDADSVPIEAIYGLNQALVDGTVPPHRWRVGRDDRAVRAFTAAEQAQALRPAEGGPRLCDLTTQERAQPPLDDDGVAAVAGAATTTASHWPSISCSCSDP